MFIKINKKFPETLLWIPAQLKYIVLQILYYRFIIFMFTQEREKEFEDSIGQGGEAVVSNIALLYTYFLVTKQKSNLDYQNL